MTTRLNFMAAAALLGLSTAIAAPGAHGPNGEHLDAPGAAVNASGLARLPDGSVNVPKLAQRRMAIRTVLAPESEAAATVELPARVVMDPNASGRVQAVHGGRIEPGPKGLPVAGQAVKRGDVLAYVRHHAEPYALGTQQAQLAELRAQRQVAEQRLQRLEGLEGTVPRKDIDAARTEARSLAERERSIGASLSSRETLTAPVNGVIARADLVVGQVVEPRDVLFEVVDPGRMLVGGLSGLQSMVAGATAGAAAGNLSMGNVSMDQIRLAPNRTSAFMSNWQNDISGNTFSSNMLTGRTAVSLLRNQGYASRVVSMRVSEQDVQDASRQVDAARSEAVAASTERSAVLSEAFSKGLAKLKSSRSSTGSTSSSFEQLGQTIDRLDQISRSVSESTGLTQSQVARIALGVTGHAGFNARFVGAQLNASADKTYLSGLSADERKVLGALTSEQASEFKQFGDRVSRDSSVASLVATDAREARELSSRIATTTARSARADASLADRAAFSERLAVARERGDSISIDIAQDPYNLAMFTRYAEQYGGTSASAQQLLSAELARQALAPTRNFSDGTGMPSSFDDVRHLYTTNSGDPRITPDIDATYRRATGAVRQAPLPVAPPAQPAPEPSDARQQIQTSSDDLRGRTAARRQEFDDERSPGRADDGTISPRQSLFKGTARQVARDAAETFQDAKDAVKGIIKR